MEYKRTIFNKVIDISTLISVHYFEFAKGYIFKGEKHPFWEFIYIDKGNVEVLSGKERVRMNEEYILFIQPNEFHSAWPTGSNSSNLIVIAFCCENSAVEDLKRLHIKLTDYEKKLLCNIVSEAQIAFACEETSQMYELVEIQNAPFGVQQLVKNGLETLIINILRRIKRNASPIPEDQMALHCPASGILCAEQKDSIVDKIEKFMYDNMKDDITIDYLCRQFNMSSTSIKRLFAKHKNCGAISYLNKIRINKSKEMIRSKKYNLTQISVITGFNSLQYFSYKFKQITKMTPTQYTNMLRVDQGWAVNIRQNDK